MVSAGHYADLLSTNLPITALHRPKETWLVLEFPALLISSIMLAAARRV